MSVPYFLGDDTSTNLGFIQILLDDFTTYSFVVEGAEFIPRLIDRYTIFESLYLQHSGAVTEQLRKALIRLYAAILKYLSEAKGYFEKNIFS
jgi:hypothetical protein